MKNVTPAAGQVWEYKEYKVKLTKVTHTTIEHENEKTGYKYVDSMDDFLSSFKFIPQNDLEWLAVKVESLGSNIKFIARRGSEYLIFETKPEHTPGLYTRQEHQNMRYELGLDEKPIPREVFEFMDREYIKEVAKRFNPSPSKRKVYPGPSPLNYPIARCYDDTVKLAEKLFMAHNKKETKMIDLSKAKVGDDYEDEKGNVFEVTANGPINVVVKSPHDGGFFIVNHDGSFFGLTSLRLVAKHDPRHWLSQLPYAGFFKLYGASYIECNEFDYWFSFSSHDNSIALNNDMMPKLTGDEWKLSKISIPDLKAWQEQNK